MITEEKYQNCPKCKSQNLIRQTGDNDKPSHQYGRLRCGDCQKHIAWLRDPSLTLQLMERQSAIDTIFNEHKSKLNSWEINFLNSIYDSRWLSEKMRVKLNGIGIKCLKKFICVPDHLKVHSG